MKVRSLDRRLRCRPNHRQRQASLVELVEDLIRERLPVLSKFILF